MQCLSAVGGDARLVECASAATQRWAVPTAPASGALRSLVDPSAAGSCLTLSPLLGGPCWENGTLVFSAGGAAPAGSKLGQLPAAFGGDITLSAEVKAPRTKQSWMRVFDFGTGVVPDGKATGNNVILACSDHCTYQVTTT